MTKTEMVEIKYIGLSEPNRVKTLRVPANKEGRARAEIRKSQTLKLMDE